MCDAMAESPRKGVAATRWIEHRQKGRFYFVDHQLQVAPYSIAVPKATKAHHANACIVIDSHQAWISVHQQDVRNIHAQPYIDIGLSVLASDRKTLIASSGIDVDRQVQLEVDLQPGM